ncbi:MAG: tRNA-intron lyase [Nanoarchaeota archaeon]
MIQTHFTGTNITSSSEEAFSLFQKSVFGESKSGKVEYSNVEILYLQENNKAEVFSGKNKLNHQELIKKLRKKDKKIEIKYAVFKDLRSKGYILKTALKFGAEFRVYERGVRPGADHARWILYTVKENDALNWHEFAAKNRVAHAVKKNLLIAIVDDESDVSYYEIAWKKI